MDSKLSFNCLIGGYDKLLVIQFTNSSVKAVEFDDRLMTHVHQPERMVPSNATHIRPMRMTVRMRNVSKSEAVGGTVRVLQTLSPLEWDDLAQGGSNAPHPWLTQGYFNTVKNMIRQNPNAKTFSAHELETTHVVHAAPGNLEGLQHYHEYQIMPLIADPNFQTTLTSVLNEGSARRGLATVYILFDTNPWQNQYDVTIHSQDAMIYPLASLGRQHERLPRTGDPRVWAQLHHLSQGLQAQREWQTHANPILRAVVQHGQNLAAGQPVAPGTGMHQ